MFIKLNVSSSVTAAEFSTFVAAVLKNHKSYNSLSDVLADTDNLATFASRIGVAGSEFVKGTTINSTTMEVTRASDGSNALLSVESRFPCVTAAAPYKYIKHDVASRSFSTKDKVGRTCSVSSATTAVAVGTSIVVSISNRHFFVYSSAATFAAFEYVVNDGFLTATSDFIPCAINVSFSWSSLAQAMQTPSTLHGTTGTLITSGTSLQLYWETPYGIVNTTAAPLTNNCYDFIDNNSEKTPILVPFGIQRKNLGIIGGSISELCDMYFGPGNISGPFETVDVGGDLYMSLIFSTTQALYIPKV